jgi:hypothetical protein
MVTSISAYIRTHHLGLIAIFIALTGTAWAAEKIGQRDIAKNAVRAKHIKDGKVGSAELADEGSTKALTGIDVAANGLTGADLDESTLFNDNSLTAADIGQGAVDTSEIAGGAVGSGEIANNSIASADIAQDAVNDAEIANGAVRSAKIENDTITPEDIVKDSSGAVSLRDTFVAGRPASPANPATAFFAVTEDVVAISRALQGGGAAVFNLNVDTGAAGLNGTLDINDGYIELDERPAPSNPGPTAARLYVRDAAGVSTLEVRWPNGTVDVLASE